MSPITAIEWNNEGIEYYNTKKYDEAITAFLKAIELDDTNPIFYKNLGDAYYDIQKTEDAFRYYKTAIQMNDKDPNFLLDFAIILHREKQDRIALTYLLKALEIKPKHGDLLYQLVVVYYSLNEIQSAIKFSQRLLKLQPTNQDGLLILARCYLDQKNFQMADLTLEQLVQINPQNSQALYLRAQNYLQNHAPVKAIKYTLVAYQFDKDNPSITESLFSYYEQAFLFGRLFPLVNQYCENHPIVSDSLGNSYQKAKILLDYYTLGVKFREALKIETENLDYLFKAEESTKLVKMIQNFLFQIETQSQKEPEQTSSLLMQGMLTFIQKNYINAHDILLRLFQKTESELYYFLLGISWLLLGSYEKSFDIWRIFIKIGKEDGTNYLFYSYCAYKLNQREFAEELLLKSHHFSPEWQVYFPTIENFDESYVQEDFFGLAVHKILLFFQ